MCGRFNLTATPEQVIETFHLHRLPRYEPSYNIPPGQKILTIVQLDDGSHKAVNLYWGLIPHWSKDRKISSRLMNARAETLAEKPAFKTAYQQRRCLILATGFYEWLKLEQGKQAYCISPENQSLFAFAGLWEYWEHDTETIYSCTIITTAANELMQSIHHRMPVIIEKQNYSNWLDKHASLETTQQLLGEDGYQGMRITAVSDWVNNPYHNDKNCLN
ncbi:MAG: SOS response-associated peptidase [Methylococcaceae bacterium]|nr:SOS response-associated peptidase [Methylococcaceae bacterium]